MIARALMLALAVALTVPAVADDEEARTRARESYEAFLRLAPLDDPRRPSALRRLADIELERAEALQLEGTDPEAARFVYDNAIELYKDLLLSYPEFAGNDTVMYQLARAQEAAGDIEAAVAQLEQLVSRYPQSVYLDESHFRRGEAFFSAGDFDLAADAYRAILAGDNAGDSDFYEQALYKLGWSEFRLGDYALATDTFLVLLNHELAPDGAYARERHEALAKGAQALIEDAMRAVSLSNSYQGGVESLAAMLTRGSAPGFEFLLYQDLGNHYLDQERFSDAAETYTAFVESYPSDTHAPHLQLKVIETYREAGFTEQELAAKESFVARYDLRTVDGYWAAHTRDDEPAVVDAVNTHLTELSRHYHALAQAGGEPANVDRAQGYYQAWLDSFQGDPAAPATHFLLAELLFAHQRFAEATVAYEATAYDYGEHERAAEAGYASLLAYGEQEKRLADTEQAAWRRRSIDGALRFSASFPQHAEANNTLVHAAERLFDLKEFDLAEDAARRLLAVQPPAQASLQYIAWTVIGHSSFDTGRFDVSEQAYQNMLALSAVDDPRREEVAQRLAASVYKQGEQRRAAGDLDGAVVDFLRVAQVAPTTAIRVTAEYDAAAALIELENWKDAATVLTAFRANHPQHELVPEVTRKLAVVYLRDNRSAEAAGELDRIARDAVFDMDTRRQALWEAADLYRDSGQTFREAEALDYFLTSLDGTLDRGMDARERLEGIARSAGDIAAADAWLADIVRTHAQATVPTERSRSAAAEASLTLADARLASFTDIRLVTPLPDSFKLKRAAMESLLADYGAAADYGVGPVTTASTYRIAEIYREMASALMDSERPPELNDAELEEYEFLLEEQAFPFEEKAIEIHEANAQRSAEGSYDDWVKRSFGQLAKLMPARYAKFEKGEVFANAID